MVGIKILKGKDIQQQTNKSSKINKHTIVHLTVTAMMTALVALATLIIQIPNPATRGYINFGDIMIFVSALTFGPFVGGIAGSVGSSLADVISGYGIYAPFTFFIKGFQGLLAGIISKKNKKLLDLLAVTIAGVQMVTGYFLVQFFLLGLGWAAITEIPGNISQVTIGALIGIPIALMLRKNLPKLGRIQVAFPKLKKSN